jgi:adenylate cyclase
MRKDQLVKILFLVVFWVFAVLFYVFIEMAIENYFAEFREVTVPPYNFKRVALIGVLVTIVGGSVIASFEVLYFNRLLSRKPFGFVLLIKNLFYLLNLFIFISIATIISSSFILKSPLFSAAVMSSYLEFISGPKIWAIMLYWGFAVMVALFTLNISEKLGQGVLLNYLLGKYHKPKEDKRIFMFLDLTSSSSYAEQLGHLKYSRLIQDCFFDLNDVIYQYDLQIYQYVGDEVVLTWGKNKGIRNNNCIKTYFAFEEAIKKRSDYYYSEYGLIPQFKAGVNFGFVTIAEVGQMKKELAYHGDAINTAAHIRSVCGKNSRKLLISADLLSLLPDIDKEYDIEYMGVCELKGKKNVVGIFSIDRKNKQPA